MAASPLVGINLGPGPEFPSDPLPPEWAVRFGLGPNSFFTTDPTPSAVRTYPPTSRPWVSIFPKRALAARNKDWVLADFDAVFTEWLAALPAGVSHVEIFNEAALNADSGPGYLKANGGAGYARVLAEANRILKASRPATRLIGFGGLLIARPDWFPQFEAGEFRSTPEFQFASAAAAAGAASSCDAVSYHAYAVGKYLLSDRPHIGFGPKAPVSRSTMADFWNRSIAEFRQILNKPMWFTETGTPANQWRPDAPNTPAFQAQFLDQAYQFFGAVPGCEGVLWWNLAGLSNEGRDYGLLDERRQPRPAYARLQAWGQRAGSGAPPA